ncbi:DUF4238 domain-containing protein [Paenibacillus sp. FSL M8-0228]|uniref:DUF4238 domain-containing protein n=1 Tax=Paenibacillus TaxID=44249 RepID=UPI00083E43F5|nr:MULTISPECIES: DUF4238 domain-containing protein [Paenibacillus]MBO3283971.1 DUF4238 domain-containing protein [Paenibacillus polymyxa]MBP1310976.1 hypothetical protein [Paenibacillus sp. 1182]ODB56200.1 hypothetical protein A7311_17995 [Paenibacillus polymyxa]
MYNTKLKRKHHFIPQTHLANFTKDGTINSRLWVFDSLNSGQWESKIREVAHKRDLYRVHYPEVKPDIFEDIFGEIEDKVGPIIRGVCEKLLMPMGDEYIWLMNYIALLAERTPARREVISKPMKELQKLFVEMDSSASEYHKTMMEETYMDNITNKERRKVTFEDEHSIRLDNNTHMKYLLTAIDAIIPFLIDRNWSVVYCPPTLGDFICSDNPVSLHWVEDKDRGIYSSPGYGLMGTEVSIPLSSRVMLLGRFEQVHPASGIIPSRRTLAILNSYTGMFCDRFIFSRKNDFFWYTAKNKIGNIRDFKQIVKEEAESK